MATINFEKDSLTVEGREQIVNFIATSSSDPIAKRNDEICWLYYNNKQDPEKYNYLRKVGNYEFPAKVRRIPKQRPYIDNLVSQQSQRPFAFSTYAVDDESISKKYDTIVRGMVKMAEDNARKVYFNIQAQLGALDNQRNQLLEVINKQPETPEEQNMLQQLRAKLPGIENQLAYLKETLVQQSEISQDMVKKQERFYQYEYKDVAEVIGQKLVRVLRQDLRIPYKEMQGIKHRCVTGKEYYYVDYIPGDKLPRFELIDGMKVRVPQSDVAGWTQYAQWVCIEEGMNYDQLMDEFEPYLNSNEMAMLDAVPRFNRGVTEGNFVATPNGAMLRNTIKGVYSGGIRSTGDYVVDRVWWRARRRIRVKKGPIKHLPGEEYTHFISTDKTIIHEADFKYEKSTRRWVSRENPDINYPASQVEAINHERGEYIKEKVVYDRYKGFVINNAIKKGFRDPIQPRPYTNLAEVMLPVVGRLYNDTTDAPYSLIWNTIDLQETYDIIHYHRELLLAISGVAGVVLDVSQRPEHMGEEEWYYNMKMGRFLIETVTKAGRKNFAFNQFPRVDMSLTASVQYLDRMLQQTDETMGMVMGVTRQRLGQTVNSDQVGTFEMSRNLSMLTTEVIFREHDETVGQALAQALNLGTRYCWEKGAMLQLIDDGIQYVNVEPNQLDGIEFVLRVENNTQEAFNLDELKKVGMSFSSKGQIPFREFVSIYRSQSLHELEMKLEAMAKEAEEMMNLREQRLQENEAEIEQRKLKFQAELENLKKESDNQLKAASEQMKAGIEQAKLQLQKEAMEFNKEKWEDEKMLKVADMQSEAQIENRIIDENTRANMSTEQANLLSNQLTAMLEMIRMKMDDQHHGKEMEVERVKARKMVREQASDR